MKSLLYIAFLSLVVQAPTTACSSRKIGNDSHQTETVGGNHGDLNAREQRLAALVGKQTFSFCVSTGSDVPSTKEKLAAQFQIALTAWRDYILNHGLSDDLKSSDAPVLALEVNYQSDCTTDTDMQLAVGSRGLSKDVQAKLELSRDSLISGVFTLKNGNHKQTLAWLAGTAAAPRPTSNFFSVGTVDHFDFSNDGELEASMRYLVGRLLGNVLTPGTILERVPEQLLECSRAEVVDCQRYINSQEIDGRYKLASINSDNIGQFDGCVAGLGRGKLIVNGQGYEIRVNGSDKNADATIKSGFSDSSAQSIQKIEVFALDDKKRLFFEQKSISGFVAHRTSKQNETLEGFEQLLINLNDQPARLAFICNDAEHVVFSTNSDDCPVDSNLTVKTFWSQFAAVCN